MQRTNRCKAIVVVRAAATRPAMCTDHPHIEIRQQLTVGRGLVLHVVTCIHVNDGDETIQSKRRKTVRSFNDRITSSAVYSHYPTRGEAKAHQAQHKEETQISTHRDLSGWKQLRTEAEKGEERGGR